MTTETAVLGGILLLGIGLLIGWMVRSRAASAKTQADLEAGAIGDLTKVVDRVVQLGATSPAELVEIAAARARRDAAIDAAVTALSKLKTPAA